MMENSQRANAWSSSVFFVHLGSTGCTGNPATGATVGCTEVQPGVDPPGEVQPGRRRRSRVDLRALLAGNDITDQQGGRPRVHVGGRPTRSAPGVFNALQIGWKADGTGSGNPINRGLGPDRVPGDREMSPAASPSSLWGGGACGVWPGLWLPRGAALTASRSSRTPSCTAGRRAPPAQARTRGRCLDLEAAGRLPHTEGAGEQPDDRRRRSTSGASCSTTRGCRATARQSCGSCHQQGKAFTDGRAQSIGSTGQTHPRSAPLAGERRLQQPPSPGPIPSLVTPREADGGAPLRRPGPSRWASPTATRRRCSAACVATRATARSSPAGIPRPEERRSTLGNVVKAIASFQRTLISGDSRYDRYLRGKTRLTAGRDAREEPLLRRAGRVQPLPHRLQPQRPDRLRRQARGADTPFHNTGLYNVGGTGAFPAPQPGRLRAHRPPPGHGQVPRADACATSGVTAPYMHDGSIATLEEVVAFYAAGGRNIANGPNAGDGRLNPFKDPLIDNIDLSPRSRPTWSPSCGPSPIGGSSTTRSSPTRSECVDSLRFSECTAPDLGRR